MLIDREGHLTTDYSEVCNESQQQQQYYSVMIGWIETFDLRVMIYSYIVALLSSGYNVEG